MKSSLGKHIHDRFGAFSTRLLLDNFVPLQSACGVLLIIVVAAVGTAIHMDESTATLIYMLMIVLFAIRNGFFQASILSVAAIFCQTYFFAEPLFSFEIMTSRNAAAVLLFELTALVVSQLAARERLYALESQRQRTKLERLYAISRRALAIDLGGSAEQQMADFILAEFQLEAIAICNQMFNAVGAAGAWSADTDELCEQLKSRSEMRQKIQQGTMQAALLTSQGSLGTLLVRGEGLEQLGLESLASLVALALERHYAFLSEGAERKAARRTGAAT